MLGIIVYGLKAFKLENEGFLSVSESLKTGLAISLIAAIIGTIYNYVFMTFIEPDFVSQSIEIAREQMLSQNPDMTQEQMDMAMGVEGEGPCQRRLAEFPPVLQLCFGALGEASQDVHNLVAVLAACRVRHLNLRGLPTTSRQMGLEVGRIRQRLSLATVRANQRVLLARTLMVDPDLLLLDEPTAGLDLGGREELVSTLADLATDPAMPPMVQVTHHVEEIPPGFTHGLLMEGGRIVAGGPLADVLTARALSDCYGLDLSLTCEEGRWTVRVKGAGR